MFNNKSIYWGISQYKEITEDSAVLAEILPSFINPIRNMSLLWVLELGRRSDTSKIGFSVPQPEIMYVKIAHTSVARSYHMDPPDSEGTKTRHFQFAWSYLLNAVYTVMFNIQTSKWDFLQEVDTYCRNCVFSNTLINFWNFFSVLKGRWLHSSSYHNIYFWSV